MASKEEFEISRSRTLRSWRAWAVAVVSGMGGGEVGDGEDGDCRGRLREGFRGLVWGVGGGYVAEGTFGWEGGYPLALRRLALTVEDVREEVLVRRS